MNLMSRAWPAERANPVTVASASLVKISSTRRGPVQAGKLGRKSGEGFYSYESK